MSDWELIQAEPTVSDFAAAVQRFDLSAVLDTPTQPVTALVPTNQAIAALPGGAAILADPVAFESFLRSHTVPGILTSEQIFALPQLTTLNGDVLTIDPVARTITGPSVLPATIVLADVHGTNGYVNTLSAPARRTAGDTSDDLTAVDVSMSALRTRTR